MNPHKSRVLLLILVLIAALPTACGTPGRFEQGEELRGAPGMNDVCDIHDDYVTKDASLDTAAKASAIAQTVIIREAFKQPSFDAGPIDAKATAVLNRTEAYVKGDTSLSPVARSVYETSIEGVRRGFNAAMKRDAPASKPAAKPPNPAPASSPATPPTVEATPEMIERRVVCWLNTSSGQLAVLESIEGEPTVVRASETSRR